MINKKIDKLAHLFLYFGFIVGIVGVFVARYDPTRQFIIAMMLVVFYLIWGFAYHHAKREASAKLYLEYLIVALIALFACFVVLMA